MVPALESAVAVPLAGAVETVIEPIEPSPPDTRDVIENVVVTGWLLDGHWLSGA
jgi:hypothetical protein